MEDKDLIALFTMNVAPPVLPVEVQAPPVEVPNPSVEANTSASNGSDPLTLEKVFIKHLEKKTRYEPTKEDVIQWNNSETLAFSKLDIVNNPEHREYWNQHLAELQMISLEVSARYARGSALVREKEAAAGITIWDRERRGTNAFNGSLRLLHETDEDAIKAAKAKRQHKKRLSAMEVAIKGFLETGDETEETIIAMFTQGGKYSAEQVKGMIDKIKE